MIKNLFEVLLKPLVYRVIKSLDPQCDILTGQKFPLTTSQPLWRVLRNFDRTDSPAYCYRFEVYTMIFIGIVCEYGIMESYCHRLLHWTVAYARLPNLCKFRLGWSSCCSYRTVCVLPQRVHYFSLQLLRSGWTVRLVSLHACLIKDVL